MKTKKAGVNRLVARIFDNRDIFRIHWRNAVQEAETYTKDKMYNASVPFERRMEATEILFTIKEMYRRDDINGYLEFLDKNRDKLKPNTIIRKEVN